MAFHLPFQYMCIIIIIIVVVVVIILLLLLLLLLLLKGIQHYNSCPDDWPMDRLDILLLYFLPHLFFYSLYSLRLCKICVFFH